MTDEMLGKRYSSEQFLTFLKVGETLYCARDALSDLCKREMDEFHKHMLTSCKIDQGKDYKHTCDSKDIKRYKLKNSCPAGICDKMLKEIEKANVGSKPVYWSNTKLTKWPMDSWEIAKVFMGPGQRPENKGPLETDSSGIFHLIRNCDRFKNLYNITENDTDELLKRRNAIAHAAVPWFCDEDLDSNITFLVEFFERLLLEKESKENKKPKENEKPKENKKLKENEKRAINDAVLHLNQLKRADFKKYLKHTNKEIFDYTLKELLHDISYEIDHLRQMFGQLPFQETMQSNGEFKAKMENFFKAMFEKVSSSHDKIRLQDYQHDVYMIYCEVHADAAKKLQEILQNVFEVKNEPLKICMNVRDEGSLGCSKVDHLNRAVNSKCIFVLCNRLTGQSDSVDSRWTDYTARVALVSSAVGGAGRAVPLRLSNSSCLDTSLYTYPEIDISPLLDREVLGDLNEEQRDVLNKIEESLK